MGEIGKALRRIGGSLRERAWMTVATLAGLLVLLVLMLSE